MVKKGLNISLATKMLKNLKILEIHLRKKKIKGKKNPEKDIKILLQKKKKKGICIIRNVSRRKITIELLNRIFLVLELLNVLLV